MPKLLNKSRVMNKLKPQWQKIIATEQQQSYYQKLSEELAQQRSNGEVIFPNEADVFSAFSTVDLPDVKVVILGQDPYHGLGANGESQAHGLAFSVRKGIKIPPSLVKYIQRINARYCRF